MCERFEDGTLEVEEAGGGEGEEGTEEGEEEEEEEETGAGEAIGGILIGAEEMEGWKLTGM